MQPDHRLPGRLVALLLAFAMAVAAVGCTIKLVADYDAAAFEEILATGKKVDKFYGTLLETKPENRTYAAFADRYVDLEADIRGMVTRNQARALNSESTEISQLILKLFVKYKALHQKNDRYADGPAKLDRDRLGRMFASAASAEEAKKLTAEDRNPDQGNP